jgi:hypothetical protein
MMSAQHELEAQGFVTVRGAVSAAVGVVCGFLGRAAFERKA